MVVIQVIQVSHAHNEILWKNKNDKIYSLREKKIQIQFNTHF